MTKQIKAIMLATAAAALAATAQAQLPVSGYTMNHNDLILGFTTAGSTGDLVIDLGTPAQIGVGGSSPVNLTSNGNVGESGAALLSQLTSLYGGLNNVQWGVVGGHYTSGLNFAVYSTVPNGSGAPPLLGTPAQTVSAINTAGQGLNDFQGSPANQGTVDPTQNYSESWTEAIASSALNPSFAHQYYNPDSPYSAVSVEALYLNNASGQQLLGTISLFGTGELTFTPVPEPATYGMLAGFGVLALTFRRRFLRK